MPKLILPPLRELAADFDKLEKDLRDIRLVVAAICFSQPDKMFTVPVATLEEMPKGTELQASYDQVKQEYVFTVILPITPEEVLPPQ